jgi:hypothetical protein
MLNTSIEIVGLRCECDAVPRVCGLAAHAYSSAHASGNAIGAEGVAAITAALLLNTTVSTVFEGATAIAEALELNSSIARIDLGGKCLFCQRVLCGRASLEFAGRGRADRQLHW